MSVDTSEKDERRKIVMKSKIIALQTAGSSVETGGVR